MFLNFLGQMRITSWINSTYRTIFVCYYCLFLSRRWLTTEKCFSFRGEQVQSEVGCCVSQGSKCVTSSGLVVSLPFIQILRMGKLVNLWLKLRVKTPETSEQLEGRAQKVESPELPNREPSRISTGEIHWNFGISTKQVQVECGMDGIWEAERKAVR